MKKWALLFFFVLFNLFVSDNVFAQKRLTKDYVQVVWHDQNNCIGISTGLYDYSFGPNNRHAFLGFCKFEISIDGKFYTDLMWIYTKRQKKSNSTIIYLRNKLENAKIEFASQVINPSVGTFWPEKYKSNFNITVLNLEDIAVLNLVWHLERRHKNVRYVRTNAKWLVDGPSSDIVFEKEFCKKNTPSQSLFKSNTTGINTIVCKNDPVKVFSESQAIVLKGADLGANIKFYTTSGVEIKSVISNNDIFKIKLPEKQIYIVHVGKSRYKVAL